MLTKKVRKQKGQRKYQNSRRHRETVSWKLGPQISAESLGTGKGRAQDCREEGRKGKAGLEGDWESGPKGD